MPRSGKLPVLFFTHRPKMRFFAPQGRLVAPIQVKLCSTDRHLGPLGCEKFHVNRCRGVEMRPPKYQQFPLLAKSQVFRPAGATRCTDSGQTLQDRRAPESAWLFKMSRQSVQTGGNAAPKISKISTFWGRIPTRLYRRAPGSAWLCKISRQSVGTGGNAAPKI